MDRKTLSAGLIALSAVATPVPAFAQSQADFVAAFAGSWDALDPEFGSGGTCRVTLDREAEADRYRLRTENCVADIAKLATWSISNARLILYTGTGEAVAALGGNQSRVSGNALGRSTLILERSGTYGAISVAPKGCTYLGYSASCASAGEMARPAGSRPAARPADATVLTRVNLRSEARPNATVVSVVPPLACVAVDHCVTASDGNWCRVQAGQAAGWIRQTNTRLGQWSVVSLTPGCGAGGG